jgi:hypothetical protein
MVRSSSVERWAVLVDQPTVMADVAVSGSRPVARPRSVPRAPLPELVKTGLIIQEARCGLSMQAARAPAGAIGSGDIQPFTTRRMRAETVGWANPVLRAISVWVTPFRVSARAISAHSSMLLAHVRSSTS